MKKLLTLTALALGSAAFAAAGPSSHTVTFDSSGMSDTITVANDITVTFTGVGAGVITGTPTLAYATNATDVSGVTTRKVTVALGSALPSGVSGSVSFTPDSGNGTGSTRTLSTTASDLVTAIPQYIVQAPKALNYAFSTTAGFTSGSVVVNYNLADE